MLSVRTPPPPSIQLMDPSAPSPHTAHGRALRRGAPALLQLQVPHPAQDQLRNKCGCRRGGGEGGKELMGRGEGGGSKGVELQTGVCM